MRLGMFFYVEWCWNYVEIRSEGRFDVASMHVCRQKQDYRMIWQTHSVPRLGYALSCARSHRLPSHVNQATLDVFSRDLPVLILLSFFVIFKYNFWFFVGC